MRAFVTGASGFVGSHLLDHLRAQGDDIAASAPPDEIDVTDRSAIAEAMAAAEPDVVYHLAAQADVGASWDHPVETLRVNVEGTLNVLDGARLAGASRVLAVTSADVYGRVSEADLPLDETTPLRPVSPYAASKAAAEMLCIQASLGHGLDVIRVRAFNHLGPGQSERFVASALASRIVANERSGDDTVRVGTLEARRDFTDVRDVVRAYRLLMTAGAAGEVYHVCSGTDRPVQEVAEMLLAMAASPMRLELDPILVRPVDLKVLRGDPSKIRAATGWKPEIPLERTLRDLLDYWRTVPTRDVGTGAGI
jgi:GDP-4-dehydro-6-deoxy-D-mannose reductase